MSVYNMLAVVFLISTIVMVAGTFFMGYLHWQEERQQPVPTPPAPKSKTPGVRVGEAANDTGSVRKAS